MTGYIRQDVGNNIENDQIADATYLDQEYDAIQSAFNASTGHSHGGGTGEGAPILTVGPTQNFVATTEVFRPKVSDEYDLGTSSLKFRDLYLSGSVNAPSINGIFIANDGTAADPSIRFLNDPDTGIYLGGTDTLSFTTDGVERMNINASGNVNVVNTLNVGGNLAVTGNITGSIAGSQINSGTIPSGRLTGVYSGVTGVGALGAGSITSGFGSINIGASNLTAGDGAFSGGVTSAGSVVAGQNFISSTTNVVLASNGSGGIFLRPRGSGTSTGQLIVGNTGNVVASGNLTVAGVYSGDMPSSNLTGIIPSARLSGSYTGITAIGGLTTLTAGGWRWSGNEAFSSNGDASFIRLSSGGTANTGSRLILIGPSYSDNGNTAILCGAPIEFRAADPATLYGVINSSGITLTSGLSVNFSGTGAATTRSNLGLGTLATQNEGTGGTQFRDNAANDARFLIASSNLSDITNTTIARSNLGLGNLATQNEGTGGSNFRDNTANDTRFYRKSLDTIAVADLPTTGDATTWVRERTSLATAGAIGTYAMLRNNTGSNISWNASASGASLSHAWTVGTDGVAVPGSWRCMGSCPGGTISLFLRVS